MTSRTWKNCASALVAIVMAVSPCTAKTLRTIAIDGNLDDWSGVLLDRDQKIADRSLAQGDPDLPSQSQRDERGVAFTWDATNLYLYFSRTGSGTNSFNAIFYIDVGHDGLLSSADKVALFKMTGSNFSSFELDKYDDGGTPDALTGDGVSEPGGLGVTLTTLGGNAAADANGIAFEASIAWASLGVVAGTPLRIHSALSSNSNLPGGVQDNTDLLDTRLPGVLLTDGTTKGTAPGRFVDFPHRVTNDGTATDTIDLSARTRSGFSVAVYSDPNGDGNPADGVLLSRDANGDGDDTDAGDQLPTAANDANGNFVVDGGTLAAGASRNFVLRVTVPAGTSVTQELVQVYATSAYRPSVRAQALDTLEVGLLSITPPRRVPTAAGQGARLAHVACNQSGVARVVDLSMVSGHGWSGSFKSDPNGDGDPTDGALLTDHDGDGLVDLGSMADATCASFVLTVSVPGGTSAGTSDALSVTASDGQTVTKTVADTVEVTGSGVDVSPDRTAKGQRGKTLYLAHDVRNATVSTDTYNLTETSTLGSIVAAMNDPDGDRQPDTSSVVTTTGAVSGSGGVFHEITRIRIPTTAVHGNVDLVDTTAASTVSDFARDTINVVGTLTYSDALFAQPASDFYGQCSTVYVLSYRTGGGTYRFAWLDPNGATMRTSPDLTPYSDGSLDDFYDAGSTPTLGNWTVKLQVKAGGGTYADVGASGTATFALQDLVAGGAAVSLNDTGADLYQLTGDALTGFADLVNPTQVDILGSTVDHVAFFDGNGDGVPTAGEDYVKSDGTIGSWALGATTASRSQVEVRAGETWSDSFTTSPVTYSRNGAWKLQTKWTASCGVLLSSRTVTFTVGCQPPPTFAGITSATDVAACAYSGIALTWPVATSWGLGTTGTYAIYRSTVSGFAPDASTLLVSGLASTAYTDSSAAPDVAYEYVVRAESDVTCSDGPNNSGLTDSNFVHATATDADAGSVPVADFASSSPDCLSGGAALMSFADQSSGPPTAWAWDFDSDGVTDSRVANPTHSFTSAGSFTVKLTVSNACGTASVSRVVAIGAPPTATIVASRTETCVGEPVALDGSSSSSVAPSSLVSFAWDLDGDGITDSTLPVPGSAQWATAGTHPVRLDVVDDLGCSATTTLDVIVDAALTVALGSPVVNECTGESRVFAQPAGGRAPYVVSWDVLNDDGAGTGSAVFGFGTTQSAVATVTDANGCVSQATSAPIAVNPRLGVTLDAPSIDACTGLVTMRAHASGGDGAYSFAWSRLSDDGTGLGSATLASSSSAETVIVTDGSGCTAQATSAPLTVNPRLSVTLDQPTIDACTGLVTLRAHASGGDGAYSFAWSRLSDDGTGLGSATLASSSSAETVIVTDGSGCTAQATSAPLIVNPRLVVTLDAPTIDGCTGRVTMRAHASGGDGAYSFAWSRLVDDGTGLGSATLASSSSAETVIVTDGAGCSAQATSAPLVVNPRLVVTLDAPTIDGCTGLVTMRAHASGGDGAYSFAWTRLSDDGTGLGSATLASSSSAETVVVTDGAGCTARATSAPLIVNPRLVVTLDAPTIDGCTGRVTMRAHASGGDGAYSFAWTRLSDDGTGLGSATLASSSAAESVTVTDGSGCSAQATSAPLVVNPRLVVTLDAPVLDLCTGRLSIRAHASGGDGAYTFAWSGLADDGSGLGTGVAPAGSSLQALTVTDGAGCSAVASVSVDRPEPLGASIVSSVTYLDPAWFLADLSASSSGGSGLVSFAWDLYADGTVESTDATFAVHVPAHATIPVRVTATDANGCVATFDSTIVSEGCPSDAPVQLLMVRKAGSGLEMSWHASTHACHARYQLLQATTCRPSGSRTGAWPADPSFLSVLDADGSDRDEHVLMQDAGPGRNLFFLVRDGGTDGTWGPAESYGSTGVSTR